MGFLAKLLNDMGTHFEFHAEFQVCKEEESLPSSSRTRMCLNEIERSTQEVKRWDHRLSAGKLSTVPIFLLRFVGLFDG